MVLFQVLDKMLGLVLSVSDTVVLYEQGEVRVLGSMQNTLYCKWAAVNMCLHYQPLDYIKEYCGVKIGLYFA